MVVVSLIMQFIAGAALMLLVAVLAFLFEGADRVVHARMQRRIGPPVLQPFLDLIKLLGKENIVPRRAVAWAFNGAPWVAAASMLVVFTFPWVAAPSPPGRHDSHLPPRPFGVARPLAVSQAATIANVEPEMVLDEPRALQW